MLTDAIFVLSKQWDLDTGLVGTFGRAALVFLFAQGRN